MSTPATGYVTQLDERDGNVYDARTEYLVATARAVHNFSVGVLLDVPVWCRTAAEYGLTFLDAAHWDPAREGYGWILEGRETLDATRHCYGHTFVALAAARAIQAGIDGARSTLERACHVINERFCKPSHGLCADEASPEWELSSYRGLNANIHTCEAMIAAYEATDQPWYLDQAQTVATTVTRELADDDTGRIWEHFTEDWGVDFEHNWNQPAHQFRPWGYHPGHHAEWAKLLCLLHRLDPGDWQRQRAMELFETAVDSGWDGEYGGFFYTVDRDGDPVRGQVRLGATEAIGVAALLSAHDDSYLVWYDRLWNYADAHFVNLRHGNWYERLGHDHKCDGLNHTIAVEPGYHPLNNAWVAQQVFKATSP